VLTLLLLVQALASPTPPVVGLSLSVDDAEARAYLREELSRKLAPAEVRGNCRQVALCLEVSALPILTGGQQTGWALAARLSRRLASSPQWPVPAPTPKPPGPVVEILEDSTAGGDLACAPCEEEKAQLKEKLDQLQAFAAERYEDVGGLGLWVGPNQKAFLQQVVEQILARLVGPANQGGTP